MILIVCYLSTSYKSRRTNINSNVWPILTIRLTNITCARPLIIGISCSLSLPLVLFTKRIDLPCFKRSVVNSLTISTSGCVGWLTVWLRVCQMVDCMIEGVSDGWLYDWGCVRWLTVWLRVCQMVDCMIEGVSDGWLWSRVCWMVGCWLWLRDASDGWLWLSVCWMVGCDWACVGWLAVIERVLDGWLWLSVCWMVGCDWACVGWLAVIERVLDGWLWLSVCWMVVGWLCERRCVGWLAVW